MKRSLDYLTRYLSAFERIKAELAPINSALAAAWKDETRRRHWGIDGIGDVSHVIAGFRILRTAKGRCANWHNLATTAARFYDRIQAN